MTLLPVPSRQTGLGRYRFRETLSTSFFGPRFRVAYEGTTGHSDAPPAPLEHAADSGKTAELERTFALRLVEVDAPSLLDKLARAVQALRDVDHVGVVKPLKIVRASTRLGIVTRQIEGVSLAKLLHDASLRQESVAPSIALRILSDVLDGLQVMQHRNHELLGREAVFGGVTPDSIHVGLDGQTRYLDPGIASAAARHSRWSHEAAALAYTAPEQTGAEYSFAAVSDIFSLGVVLWELLTLRPLFGASTAAQTLQRLHQAPIPRVQRQQFVRGEPIAAALAQVVAHALRREPAQRYGSYDEFAIALNAAGTPASRANVADLVRRTLLTAPQTDYAEPPASQPRGRIPLPANSQDSGVARIDDRARTAANDHALVTAEPELDFEPPTTKIPELPRDDFWPANAAWMPPVEPEIEQSPKITAFPLGDLLRRPYSGRRDVWSIGAACVAALGIGVVVWTTTGDAPRPRATAAAPPSIQAATDTLDRKPATPPSTPARAVAAPLTASSKPAANATADAGTNTAPSTAAPKPAAAAAQGPAAPTQAQPAPAVAPPRPRKAVKSESRHAPGSSTPASDPNQQQFIPDDI